MTTPARTTNSNKTALRASLKKEDESLAERLVATDVALVAPQEPEAPAAAAPETQAATAPVRKSAAKPADEVTPAAVVEAPGKAAKKAAPAKTRSAKGSVAAAKARSGSKKAAAAKPQAKVEAAAETGKKTAGLEEALEKIEKAAVLDRNCSFGSGGIFANELSAALHGQCRTAVYSYISGLGGRDITVDLIKELYSRTRDAGRPDSESVWLGLNEE